MVELISLIKSMIVVALDGNEALEESELEWRCWLVAGLRCLARTARAARADSAPRSRWHQRTMHHTQGRLRY